jgi:hypothetical protein
MSPIAAAATPREVRVEIFFIKSVPSRLLEGAAEDALSKPNGVTIYVRYKQAPIWGRQ